MAQPLSSCDDCKYVHNDSSDTPVSPSKSIQSDETITNEPSVQNTNTEKLNIVFIDWDDTLLPTHIVVKGERKNMRTMPFYLFGKHLYELLLKYVQLFGLNNIYIVTEKSHDWVQQSLMKLSEIYNVIFFDMSLTNDKLIDYFALIYKVFFRQYQLRVVSAQNFYCSYHPNTNNVDDNKTEKKDIMKWKLFTFKSIIHDYYLKEKKSNIDSFCILSIGDSMDEYNASYHLKQWMQQQYDINNVILHRIKLSWKPSIERLMEQCKLLIALIAFYQSEQFYDAENEFNYSYEHHILSNT